MFKKTKRIIIIIALLFVAIAGYYLYSIIKFGLAIQQKPEVGVDDDATYKEELLEWEGKERVNILLIGGDERSETDRGRSDTLMIASIDPITKKAHLLSVLRDTYTTIPEYGKRKINEAYTYGGPKLAMKTVSDLTGLPIHYYVYIDFNSFVKLIDAIGGIEFEVEKNMHYVDKTKGKEFVINLKKGLQHLDGDKALQYVRFRYDATSDYTRTERQREFLKAVFAKIKSTSTIVNLPKILDELAPYIETNMELSSMLKLAMLGLKVNLTEIETTQLPPMELLREAYVNQQAVLLVDEKKLQQYVMQQLETKTNENSEEQAP